MYTDNIAQKRSKVPPVFCSIIDYCPNWQLCPGMLTLNILTLPSPLEGGAGWIEFLRDLCDLQSQDAPS
jgi:hypothetical protein